MSSDLSDQIQSAVEWVIRLISGLGFLLPIAIFLVANLVSGRNKSKQKQQPSTPARTAPPQTRPQASIPEIGPIPAGPFTWLDPAPVTSPTPTPPARDDPYRHEDSALQWGSLFDDAREKTKWGWDETEWGGDYATRRDSEPKITIG